MKIRFVIAIACVFSAVVTLQAQIIHVPADYPMIQQGINAADPGDTVLVSEGIYYEQINFKGKKPLMVASNFILDGDPGHISNTIIDGSQVVGMDSASVVYYVSGEDTTSILCGFTIRNGTGTYTYDQWGERNGGGIWISESGAKIIHNRITHNILDDTQPIQGVNTAGGGIASNFAEGDYWVVIEHNTIDSNTCISMYDYTNGGGIGLSCNCRIVNNLITNNVCYGALGASAVGGGIVVGGDDTWTTPLVAIIEHNTISYNAVQYDGGIPPRAAGVSSYAIKVLFSFNELSYNTSGSAAGFDMWNPRPGSLVSNNIFKGNISEEWTGGLHLVNNMLLENPVLVENNYFLDNTAKRGGAFTTMDVEVTLQNNVFSGNHADLSGGAAYLYYSLYTTIPHLATLINNSFSGNIASSGYGGAILSNKARSLIFNSIFWQNAAPEGPEIMVIETSEIAFSNIDPGGIGGEYVDGGGNIFEDPLFSDTTWLTLDPSSGCIESGTGDVYSEGVLYNAPEYDILGQPRPLDYEWDLGAYESFHVGIDNKGKQEAGGRIRVRCFPNPVVGRAEISYQLAVSGQRSAVGSHVRVTLHDMSGKQVRILVDKNQVPGEYTIPFNTSDLPTGIYLIRLQAGEEAVTEKVVIMNCH